MTKVYVVSRLERNYRDDWDTSSEKVFYNKDDAIKFIRGNPDTHELYFDWEEVDIE
jgi:hypothetical protein